MDKPVLVIGNKNYSSWSLRAWLMLRHAGVDFAEERIALYAPGSREKLSARSPSGKVPVYLEDGFAVWDTLAIGEYLYERFPALWPSDARERAVARSVSAEMHSGFFALREAMPMNLRARDRHVPATAAVQADIDRVTEIWRALREAHDDTGPWLFGEYSIADAMFAPVAFRFLTYGVPLSGDVEQYVLTLAGDPLLQPWLEAARVETEVIEASEVG